MKVIPAVVSLCALTITGCVSPLRSADPETRKQAVEKIMDDQELFFIAMNVGVGIKDKWPELYSETHLRPGEYPEDVRVMAVRKIKNPEYLLRCASWKDGDCYVDPAFESGKFLYKGETYYIGSERQETRIMIQEVFPGDAVRKAAIENLLGQGGLNRVAKCFGPDTRTQLFPLGVYWYGSSYRKGGATTFVDEDGNVRKDNPLDMICSTIVEKETSLENVVQFIYNASDCGFEIVPNACNAAMHKLAGLTSKDATVLFKKVFLDGNGKEKRGTKSLPDWWPWAIYQYIENPDESIVAVTLKRASTSDVVKIVDKVHQPSICLSLLNSKDPNGGGFEISKPEARARLLARLSEETATQFVLETLGQHSVRKWMQNDLIPFDDAVAVAVNAREPATVTKVVSAMFRAFTSYEKACEGSWAMHWDGEEREKVNKLLARLPKFEDSVIEALICLDEMSWKHFADSISENVAYTVLVSGKAKSKALEHKLVDKLPATKVDMKVYNGVRFDETRKAVMAKMPPELKKVAAAEAEKVFRAICEKAKSAAKEKFELDGFYLGMTFDDMKTVFAHHFPTLEIKEGIDGEGKDADYVIYVPGQSSPFCYASVSDKKVWLFNFGKKLLKKWYPFDVQTPAEWVAAYERATKVDMRFKLIEKDTTVYEPMDMSRSYRVWFHQESYQYRHNTKKYRLTYFGEQKDFTLEGGLGGDVIKEMAASSFRYVRGDPDSLRVQIERD